jgi:tetratricopeptide (TPR) repeat protein
MNLENITSVIEDSVYGNGDFSLARKIIDSYSNKNKSIRDHELLVEICLKINYYEVALRSLKYLYTNCENNEKLFGYRSKLCMIYFCLNEMEKSLFYNDLNLQETIDDFDTLLERSKILSALGKEKEAEKILKNLALNCHNTEMKLRLNCEIGRIQLRKGDIDIGIRNSTLFLRNFNQGHINHEFWDGTPKPGKTIIVNGHGGIGDEILYIRFFKRLKEMGMRPILFSGWAEGRTEVDNILIRNGFEVVNSPYSLDKSFLWVNLLALCSYMNLNSNNIWTEPYIFAKKDTKKLIKSDKFKIGIKTQGNLNYSYDKLRSFSINQLLKVLPKEASIYCFDEIWVQDKIEKENKTIDVYENWENTLGLIEQMDVIISADTSIAHAAGAMGKNTILLIPTYEHFIWIPRRKDGSSIWYGNNFKVIQQDTWKNYDSCMDKVGKLLSEYINK